MQAIKKEEVYFNFFCFYFIDCFANVYRLHLLIGLKSCSLFRQRFLNHEQEEKIFYLSALSLKAQKFKQYRLLLLILFLQKLNRTNQIDKNISYLIPPSPPHKKLRVQTRLFVGLMDKSVALQTEQKGCRLRSFECAGDGVYQDVNDRSPNHEERAQDAPLSSVWWRGWGHSPTSLLICASSFISRFRDNIYFSFSSSGLLRFAAQTSAPPPPIRNGAP